MVENLVSNFVRLSEVLSEIIHESQKETAKEKFQRLASDSMLVVYGRYSNDYTTHEDNSGQWKEISPAELRKVDWEWEANQLKFDPNDVPDGEVANFSCYVDVSFDRFSLEEILANNRPRVGPVKRAKLGRAETFDWDAIELFARSLARDGKYTSANKFYQELSAALEEKNGTGPGITTMKDKPALKAIANQFSRK